MSGSVLHPGLVFCSKVRQHYERGRCAVKPWPDCAQGTTSTSAGALPFSCCRTQQPSNFGTMITCFFSLFLPVTQTALCLGRVELKHHGAVHSQQQQLHGADRGAGGADSAAGMGSWCGGLQTFTVAQNQRDALWCLLSYRGSVTTLRCRLVEITVNRFIKNTFVNGILVLIPVQQGVWSLVVIWGNEHPQNGGNNIKEICIEIL